MFKPVSPKVDFPKLEEEILDFWKKNNIFEKSVENRPKDKTWTFLDGPPFITGLPHYGTLLASIPKDIFPRFWTMKGYRVRRVWGWDCHGLPAENKVETSLGLKRKKDIEEKIGVKKFIDECKLYVSKSSSEWEWYVDHIGRWVDFKNAYKTMDLPYMESVMWVFKQMYEKNIIYKGLRVSLYCPHCATPISNFEVAMDPFNYKEVTEPANVYKYQLEENPETFLLAWSTTPWTKIVTSALAVNPKLTYVKIKQGSEFYILAKDTLKILTDEPYKIIETFKGKDLIGKKFIPHYDYYEIEKGKKAFIVTGGEFVTESEGTGIVTLAAYGEEDLSVMQKESIQLVMHLDDEGMVKQDVPQFGGAYYLKVNELVNDDLRKRGLMYREDPIVHSVPHCWRCGTRLYYAPQNAWYVNVQVLKKQMEETNKKVNWYPSHFKEGRFLKSLQQAPDWCISRSRYWGSPVPVWECECGEKIVVGSIAELEKLTGKKVDDLHKPAIDQLTIRCHKCSKEAHRVPEVLDSWIEAGSASFAERHFPFNKAEELSEFFPPDFIVEYTGQIRAWFYVLHVIANALYDSNAFKNVLVTGVILGTDGRKMSKNFGNYPDPKEMLGKYGGDALRLYLTSTPVMHGEDIKISEEQYRNQVRGMLLILWNTYNFFVTYANISSFDSSKVSDASDNVLDKWILSLLQKTVEEVTESLEKYNTEKGIAYLQKFIDEFSTWYIRRSRDRVGVAKNSEDSQNFFSTCYIVLKTFCKIFAPFAPFISEEIYKNLTGEESVHLSDWPTVEKKYIDEKLEQEMQFAKKIVELGHSIRKENNLKTRQPLGLAYHSEPKEKITNGDILHQVLQELNIKQFINDKEKESFIKKKGIISNESDGFLIAVDTNITPELEKEGEYREIVRSIQEERKRAGTKIDQFIEVTIPSWPAEFEEEIKKKALVKILKKGDVFSVRPI